MKPFLGALLVLAAISAAAQTTNFSQIQHIETALNHLTVIDFGEPVVTVAVADPDSVQIERHDDKVFIKPLKDGASTNLFVWTASRQLAYEIDPAGDLAKMNVMIRSAPPAQQKPNHDAASSEPSDQQIQKIASLVLTQALMGSENIVRESGKVVSNGVSVELEQVFRSKDALYVRYTISNQTAVPFRISTPDVHEAEPTGQPISLVALRNHQLSPHTATAFKAKLVENIPVINADSASTDIPPGQKCTGVVSIRVSQGNQPQLYQLNFGNSQGGSVTAAAVL
jgi:Conjugal transfer protein